MGSLCFKGLYYPIIDASLKPSRDREIFSFKSYLLLVLELSNSVTDVVNLPGAYLKLRLKEMALILRFPFSEAQLFCLNL